MKIKKPDWFDFSNKDNDFHMKHTTRIEKTKIVPLRWIGNFFGERAGNHLVKCFDYDDDNNHGFFYKYHSFMWMRLNKPYTLWGTYFELDIKGLHEDLGDAAWDDYDEFGKAYWDEE
jgi:hypothetical protein